MHENVHGTAVPKAFVQGWGDGRDDKGKEGIERGRGRGSGKERTRERKRGRGKESGKGRGKRGNNRKREDMPSAW